MQSTVFACVPAEYDVQALLVDEGVHLEEAVQLIRIVRGQPYVTRTFRLSELLPILRETKSNPKGGYFLTRDFFPVRPKLVAWLQLIGLVPGTAECERVWSVRIHPAAPVPLLRATRRQRMHVTAHVHGSARRWQR